jgi:2-polyprenyl-3-methyl-5-hydroxy-6-metoxy-1,4-benzoquinol methylase
MLRFIPESARAVLEVGCDTGRFGAMLRRRDAATVLVGVEPDRLAGDEAEKVFDRVVCGTFPAVAESVRRPGGFDAIVFNDVLEHMAKPEDALEAARDLLSSTGIVVASVPNVRHISAVGPLVIRGEWRYRDIGILDSTHLRFFTEKSIRRLFEGNGWEVLRLEPLNRCVRIDEQSLPRWVRPLGWLTRGVTDPFFVLQYGVAAR